MQKLYNSGHSEPWNVILKPWRYQCFKISYNSKLVILKLKNLKILSFWTLKPKVSNFDILRSSNFKILSLEETEYWLCFSEPANAWIIVTFQFWLLAKFWILSRAVLSGEKLLSQYAGSSELLSAQIIANNSLNFEKWGSFRLPYSQIDKWLYPEWYQSYAG
jgi:hypothetical protein